MNKIINWIKENKLFSTIIVGVTIELISTGMLSAIHNVDFIKSTKMLCNAIYSFISIILNFRIPVWFIIATLFIIYLVLLLIIKINKTKGTDNSWYESYTTDSYRGVLYNWYYYKNFEGKLDLKGFRPICKYCKGDLTTTNKHGNSHYMMPRLYCPNCDEVLETPSSEDIEQAELFVRNNLKKKLEDKIEKDKLNNK